MKRILITWWAWFIWSNLAEKYLKLGNEVYIIDNLSTWYLENIKHLQENHDYKDRFFVTIDTIFNEDKMTELVWICDVVIHLAAAVWVKYILDNPLTSITTNIVGTEMILKLSNRFRKKVLIASTSEVYWKQSKDSLSETDDITFWASIKARWSYAVAKLMDEFTALAYFSTTKLPVVIVRFFNTVWPKQTWEYGMVIPRFVQKALRDEDLLVFWDWKQTRTFTDVNEVCECIIKLMDSEKAIWQVVNIWWVEEVSIEDLAKKIIQKTWSKSNLKYIPYDQVYSKDFDDMPRRVPCVDKLKSLVWIAPNKWLDEILDNIISYAKINSK